MIANAASMASATVEVRGGGTAGRCGSSFATASARAASAAERAGRGRGLGIAKRAARELGGRVSVEQRRRRHPRGGGAAGAEPRLEDVPDDDARRAA